MAIPPVNGSSGHRIAQALQGRADQGGPTLAIVEKLHGRWHAEAIGDDTLVQGGDWAGNSLGFSLVF
jgi:hypothetical protein